MVASAITPWEFRKGFGQWFAHLCPRSIIRHATTCDDADLSVQWVFFAHYFYSLSVFESFHKA